MKPIDKTPQKTQGSGRSASRCSHDLPFDSVTPHRAIEEVIDWLGIGFETEITRKSDGRKITIKITS